MKPTKLLEQILGGRGDANIDFADLCSLMLHLNFSERVKGSHHIYHKTGVEEIVNLQPRGRSAKPYQVKQVRNIILKYRLEIEQ